MSNVCRVLAVVGLAVSSSAALGQSAWLNPTSGSWSSPGNWTHGVPNSPAVQATLGLASPYSVQLDVGVWLGSLSITNPNVELDILDGRSLSIAGNSITNAGVILLNSTGGGNSTYLYFDSSATLDGTGGVLALRANPGNLDTAYMVAAGGTVLTNAAGHTISGNGHIYLALANQGAVNADVNGRTLRLDSNPKSNTGTIKATGGGRLDLSSFTLTQGPSGLLTSDVVDLSLTSMTVSGGTISATGGAHIAAIGALHLQGGVETIGSLDIIGGGSVQVDQTDLLHSGTVTINPAGDGNGTGLFFNQSGTIVGSTQVVLNANPGNLDTAYLYPGNGSVLLTIPATTTISGSGHIYVPFVNNGLIHANVPGRTLRVPGGSRTNNTTIKASGGGRIELSSVTLYQDPSALLTSDVVDLPLINMTISGGKVTATGGAHLVDFGTLRLQGNVATVGELDITGGSSVQVDHVDLIHNGTIIINPAGDGNGTGLYFNQSGTIVGPTDIVLNANPGNLDTAYIYPGNGSVLLTIPATTTVRGTGHIYVPFVNNGLIHANVPGRIIRLVGAGKTNNTTIKASGGGRLEVICSSLVQGSSGLLTSDGVDLSLVNMTLSGGKVTATGGAHIVESGALHLQGDVSTSGPLDVPGGSSIQVDHADLRHSGVITINTAADGNGTGLYFNQSGTIIGSTEIVLNANPGNLDTAYLYPGNGSVVLTIPATTTIRGTGNIYPAFVNNGLIHANVPSRTLALSGPAKTNNTTIKATGGGSILLNSITLNQGTAGKLTSDGADIAMINSRLVGGLTEVSGGGVLRVIGNLTVLGGAAWNGDMPLPNGNLLVVQQPSTLHSGVVTVNSDAGGNATYVRFDQPSTIDGGELLLNANPGSLDTAYLHSPGVVTTLGGQETLRGKGRLYGTFINEGTTSIGVTPGAIGVIDCPAGSYTMGQDAVLEVDVGGTDPNQFDRLTSSQSITVGGTIRVRLANGYEPVGGETFDVVTAATRAGSFSYYDIDTYPSGAKRFAVKYLPGKVQLMARGCSADFDGSGFVDTDDFTDYVHAFEEGTDDADFDGSGFVDTDDFTAYVHAFEAGC